MDGKARNENKMESLMSNEEDKTVFGMYLDALSYGTLISISGMHGCVQFTSSYYYIDDQNTTANDDKTSKSTALAFDKIVLVTPKIS